LFCAAAVLLFYPETQGKTLQQMDELFGEQMVLHALLRRPSYVRKISHHKNRED
jgi:hypothetical protein